MPCGLEEAVLVQHADQDPAKFRLVEDGQDEPAFDAGHEGVGYPGEQVGVALVVVTGPGSQAGEALDRFAGND